MSLGDLSSFKGIVADVQGLTAKGDLAGAVKRITDYETAWDQAETAINRRWRRRGVSWDTVRSGDTQPSRHVLPAYPGGFDPLDHVQAVDLGDVYLRHSDPLSIPASIEAAAMAVIETGATLVGLGGDHFITFPLLRATAKHHGKLALVQLDAHPDTWVDISPVEDGLLLDHGTMFRKAVTEGVINTSRSIQVGIRTWVDDPLGMAILDNVACDDLSIKQIGDSICGRVGDGPCYLTVDIDCLDPAFAPGTGTSVTRGLTPLKLLRILREIADLDIVGCNVVEMSPLYDVAGITALNAATVVYEQFCRIARRRGATDRRYPDLGY